MSEAISYQSLPAAGNILRQTRQEPTRPGSPSNTSALARSLPTRRTFISRAGLFAGLVSSGAIFSLLRVPAAGAARVCTASLTYRNDCNGERYVSCSGGLNGCARVAASSSTSYCLNSNFASRHKTCTENFAPKLYWYRTDACYDSASDGWRWTDTAKCGCAGTRTTWCKDGWTSFDTGGSFAPTICETYTCT